MTGFVLDASVAVTWLFQDRAREDCDLLQFRLASERGCAPELWRWEVASVWLKKARRDGLSAKDADAIRTIFDFFSSLVRLEEASPKSYRAAVSLALRHQLSAYDAAYLELSIRENLPLATLDRSLIRAAADEGVRILPEPA